MKNLHQYAAAFVAIGCKLAYESATNSLDIVDYPHKPLRAIVKAAIDDIVLFEDTANFQDGSAAPMLAEFLDGEPNPIPQKFRLNVLTSLGIMREGKYVQQALQDAKTNRSWHVSEKAGECTFFGKLCTHRGIAIDPHKRGRRSEREPYEYHKMSSKGIGREQLVTPALHELYNHIPLSVTISNARPNKLAISYEMLQQVPKDKLEEFIRMASEVISK